MTNKINPSLFRAHEQALNQHESCPKCGAELQVRHGKHGSFLGCGGYPECDYIRPLHSNDGHIVKELGVECPECGHELVLRQGRYGMFIGCSHYPDCHHIEPSSPPTEETASESVECPECQRGHLIERKSRYGKTFWSCDAYPKCKFALNSHPVEGPCQTCGYPLLIEKKYASGVKRLCADRKCSAEQS